MRPRQFLARGGGSCCSGADFLLLLFCLALPFRQFRHLVPAIATFTGGLTLALVLALSGVAPDTLWFQPLVEMLAAASILLAAFANIIGRVTPRRRALFALGAGLVFGFICAAHLGAGLQFGGAHVAVAEVAFGAGAVLTMAGVMALLVTACSFLFSLRESNISNASSFPRWPPTPPGDGSANAGRVSARFRFS